ncbi:Putrescine importer [Enterobacter cancerogenus]|uniref:Putrescine importer n=1 Tax=Enterobacter cancerogenus TaxID=69218 RepID=A0A484XM82_9ENTR|nr:Putrescine importer [Enterobacter cancerogenus]
MIALVAFMTAFNLRSIKSVANFNSVIVVLQVVLIAVILGMVIYGVFHGEGAGTLARQANRSGLVMRMSFR